MKWVTRERPKTDRIACPWLIRNFIDSEAEFLYVSPDDVLKVADRESAHSYDAPGARYTHRDGLCSFEVLIQDYEIDDAAVGLLARIVHGADVAEDRDATPQSRGLLAIAEGFHLLDLDDHRQLELSLAGLRRALRLVQVGDRDSHLTPDGRRIVRAQAARAVAYGLGSVLIGVTLAERGLSSAQVALVLTALLVGTAVVSVLVGRYADRIGRRTSYRLLFVAMAIGGTVFALTGWLPALILASLTGTVSTDVVESGPFTSLEQAMLPQAAGERDPTRLFGTYNTIATLAGSFGALLALRCFISEVAARLSVGCRGRPSRDEPLVGGDRT